MTQIIMWTSSGLTVLPQWLQTNFMVMIKPNELVEIIGINNGELILA